MAAFDGERLMVEYPESLDGKPPPPPQAKRGWRRFFGRDPQTKRGWWRFLFRHLPGLTFSLLVAFLAVTVLWPYVVITVPSGQVGVLWKRFNGFDFYCWCFVGRGTMLNPQQLRGEGLHIIWPWDKLFIYNLRLQSTAQTYNAISKDGVNVVAQINIRFQLLHNSIAVLHKFIGPAYLASVVGPEIGSQARQVISQYTAQEVYVSREAIQEQIRENARRGLGVNLNKLVQPEAMEQPDPKHYTDFLQYSIQILDTLVLSIELPPAIVAAINRQTEQYYLIQEYRYRVAREAEESKRKQIEANGIAAFQRTVSQGISDSYLRWRGIEATLALSQSPNAKIVVIGGGKDGLPIILGNVDTPAASTSAAKPADGLTTANDKTSAASPATPDNVPPGTPSMTPSPTPAGGGSTGVEPPGTSSSDSTPPASDKTPTAAMSAAPASPNKPPSSSSPLDLSHLEAILSRISEALRSTGSAPGSGTGAQPKQ
jgi:regulator of protease activity HflC (stomatin/prohibitin superfamily)